MDLVEIEEKLPGFSNIDEFKDHNYVADDIVFEEIKFVYVTQGVQMKKKFKLCKISQNQCKGQSVMYNLRFSNAKNCFLCI